MEPPLQVCVCSQKDGAPFPLREFTQSNDMVPQWEGQTVSTSHPFQLQVAEANVAQRLEMPFPHPVPTHRMKVIPQVL